MVATAVREFSKPGTGRQKTCGDLGTAVEEDSASLARRQALSFRIVTVDFRGRLSPGRSCHDGPPARLSMTWPSSMLFRPPLKRFVCPSTKRLESAACIHGMLRSEEPGVTHANLTFSALHALGCNVASAFAVLHGRGCVVGDLAECAVLVDDSSLVTFADSDSLLVATPRAAVFRCVAARDEYTPPELQPATSHATAPRGLAHDRFSLAVLLFELLMEGFHPYAGVAGAPANEWGLAQRIARGNFPFGLSSGPLQRPPRAPPLSLLHPRLQELFLRCFVEGSKNPELRPTAAAWQSALLLASSELQACWREQGHVYGRHLESCPWCERQLGADPLRSMTNSHSVTKDRFPTSESVKWPTPLLP